MVNPPGFSHPSEYPCDFGLGPNPREPSLNSKVSKAIQETLDNSPENLHFLNRGLTIVAKDIQFDNQRNRLLLALHDSEDEQRYFGILDGGNTNARINGWRESLSPEMAEDILRDACLYMSRCSFQNWTEPALHL